MKIKNIVGLYIVILFTASCAHNNQTQENQEFIAFGKELKQLKELKGHYQGQQWNPKIDAYDGEKHKLLQKIADYAVAHQLSAEFLVEQLGTADRSGIDSKTQLPYLAYYWREEHDYLSFLIDQQKVSGYIWFHGYE